MSNLEHLIENGLCRLDEGKSYREWREIMQQDCNWEGNENITIDNLWEICQYVIFTWDVEPVKRGHWIRNIEGYKCSECGEILCCYGDYCLNCGAKMDEISE